MAAWTHPDVGLGELVDQAAAFLDIFILASGYQSDGSLAFWSPGTLQKALGWAYYFEQVLEKLPTGAVGDASKLALDLALDAVLAAVPLPPGISGFSCSTLVNARSLLVHVLMQSLPIQNARLVANFVNSSENGNGDLWEAVIAALSERCLAFGSVAALQQVLDAFAGSYNTRTITAPRIWKSSEASFGYKTPSSVRWAKEALKYITSAETMHKLSGATLIFMESRDVWTQVLDSLQRHRDGRTDVRPEIAELCCLFLASTKWKELPRRVLHPACQCFGGSSTERHKNWWVGQNLADVHLGKEVIPPKVKDEVEGYLHKLLDSDSGTIWWALAPILLAAVFADSSALQLYFQLVGKRINDAPNGICSSDCSCQACCHRSDARERAWCLLMLLDGHGGHSGSDLTKQLHACLGFPLEGNDVGAPSYLPRTSIS